jgi:signal transduction histidine kinase
MGSHTGLRACRDSGEGEVTLQLRVLQIEDVEDDALLVAIELRRGGWRPLCTRVDTAREMRAALDSGTWDLVISDFGLPSFDAPSALSVLQEFHVDIPFIIVSGTITEQAAVAAMKAGAHDYVTKDNLNRLVPAVRRELREAELRREHRHTEELRRRAEARFRTLVESIDGVVFTVNNRFFIDGVFGRGLGRGRLDESRYLGKNPNELFEDEVGAPDYSACARAFAGEQVVQEWTREQPWGVQYLHSSLSPISLDDGAVPGLVGLVRDATEQKNLEAKVLQTERMASLGALAASVGHEINNPLAALLANLEVVSQDTLALAMSPKAAAFLPELAKIQEVLGDAREGAQRVRQVAHDLRVVSRATEDRREPVDVRHAIESSIRMAWNEIRHRAKLVCDFHEVPPVMASEARLGQVFLNLLVNAAQAIPAGDTDGNEVRVCVRTHGPEHVVVEVADTGQGIPEAVKQRLFTPFFTTKPEGMGTGLGLSICQRIVTSFGGSISVESTVGKGTAFRVVLPAAADAPMDESTPPPQPRKPERRGQVLVVDDEAMLQRAIQRTLCPLHDVVTVGSGRKAFALIEGGQRFDVIFCDLMMPEMTGVELYSALTAVAPEQATRVVFLTGGAFMEYTRAFLESIPNLTVEKPFESKRLLQVVAERIADAPA